MPKVLVVEDDVDLATMVRTYLQFEHYEVETVHDGKEGSVRVGTFEYDLVILDLGLPIVPGLDVLRALRARGKRTPVIILTGKDSIAEKEAGLDAGADDYLTKPFHMKELGARLRALLRRPAPIEQSEPIMIADLKLDRTQFVVTRSGNEVDLMPREFQLLEFFMRHPNQIFPPETLTERIWQDDSAAAVPALRTTMRRLRKKVDPDGNLLKTVHGSGYILKAE